MATDPNDAYPSGFALYRDGERAACLTTAEHNYRAHLQSERQLLATMAATIASGILGHGGYYASDDAHRTAVAVYSVDIARKILSLTEKP